MPDVQLQWIAVGARGFVTDPKSLVLLVEDELQMRTYVRLTLTAQGFRVLEVESGREALEMLDKLPGIEVVLMDIMMPEMDGYQTMRAIRQMPQFRNLPIIALTAKAMKGDREKCLEAGASDYIAKPVNLDDLIWLLRAWLPRVAERQ